MAKTYSSTENEQLTRTGPDTEMGNLMRRYWFPALLSERLPEAGGDPIGITLLGEDLVAFRGNNGEVGLMASHCPHRRASLVLARPEGDCSLRCIYHGWQVDASGRVLETPPEPPNSKFAKSIRHPSYPTREAGGIIWTYMGPPEQEPEFPKWPFTTLSDDHVWSVHFFQSCNWLQGLEGDLDAAHAGYLHYSVDEWEKQRGSDSARGKFLFDPRPDTGVEAAQWGLKTAFKYRQEDESQAVFWVHPYIAPMFTMFSHSENGIDGGLFHAWVPSTDDSHYVYSVVWRTERPLSEEDRKRTDETQGYTDLDQENGYLSKNWDGEKYVQDRSIMRSGDSFSGFVGVHLQDLAVQHSMGPIVDRTRENLCAEDFLVIQVRDFLLEALRKLGEGDTLPGLHPDMDHSQIEYRWVSAPSDTPVSQVLSQSEWNSGLPSDPHVLTNDGVGG